MSDMLVKLYNLPEGSTLNDKPQHSNTEIRRALATEKHIILNWIETNFSRAWSSECDVSFSNKPVSCYLAILNGTLIGFACYDAVCRAFFGPMGVLNEHRGLGVGKGLLLRCLYAMREQGYAYAIIGGVGPAEFYAKCVGAVVIDGSDPGIYKGVLK